MFFGSVRALFVDNVFSCVKWLTANKVHKTAGGGGLYQKHAYYHVPWLSVNCKSFLLFRPKSELPLWPLMGCLQEVTGDARSRVNSYNWTGSTAPLLEALLLDISRYNDTAWDTYSRLVRTLEHMSGTFWSSLSASVNALPTTSELRLLEVIWLRHNLRDYYLAR